MLPKSRFAPSPTGFLHIGNARSAIINWAFINNKGGKFILRIDDTDSERSKKKYEDAIKRDLKWLGINWFKTFNQSERSKIYQKRIKDLKKIKRLYPCFETSEELSLKRKSLLAAGKPPIYDRSALQINEEQIEENINRGKIPHWRFKLENKIIKWNDLIMGEVSFDSKNLSDPILIRENNSLLYHLPSVIDDIDECITDVIRGEDHLTNTAFHIQIFEALNASVPSFGHHSLLTDEQGKKFGKRLENSSIKLFKDKGVENITLINYLLTVGTSQNISKEKNIQNLCKNFSIKNLTKSSPKFSTKVIQELNKDILQSYEFSEVKQKFKDHNLSNVTNNFWIFTKNNINSFSEALNWWEIINSDKIHQTKEHSYLKIAAQLLPEDPFTVKTWGNWTSEININTGRTGKELYLPLRIALTGQDKGPELRYLMPLLNKKQVLRKLGS